MKTTNKKNEYMDICFITDSNYVIATLTAIKSIELNSPLSKKFHIHVLVNNITDYDKECILKLKKRNIKIDVIDVTKYIPFIECDHPYVTKTALLKFYLPEIFSDKNKILYLDCDVLATGDISEFEKINISEVYAAVCEDMHATQRGHAERLQHKKYFNSGVMFLNLKKLRSNNIVKKLIEYKKNEVFDDFMDQNAFNKIFNEEVIYLSPVFNYLTTLENDNESDIADFYKINCEELKLIKKSTIVLHIAGGQKPWENTLSNTFNIYLPYLFKLPNYEIKTKTISNLFTQEPIMDFIYNNLDFYLPYVFKIPELKLRHSIIHYLYKRNFKRFIKYCAKQIYGLKILIQIYEGLKECIHQIRS